MSSYLTLYGVLKKADDKASTEEKKHEKVETISGEEKDNLIPIVSFSRNNEIYSYFDENLNVPFNALEESKYLELTHDDVDKVESDINEDITRSTNRLHEYEKYAGSNMEYIPEILSTKEYIEDLQRVKHQCEFIHYIITEASYSTGFEKIVADLG